MDNPETIYTTVVGNYKIAIEADLARQRLQTELEALMAEGLPVAVVKDADDYAILHAQAERRLQIVADRAQAIEMLKETTLVQARYMQSQGLPIWQPFKLTVVTDTTTDENGETVETTADVFCRLQKDGDGVTLEHSLDGVTTFP